MIRPPASIFDSLAIDFAYSIGVWKGFVKFFDTSSAKLVFVVFISADL